MFTDKIGHMAVGQHLSVCNFACRDSIEAEIPGLSGLTGLFGRSAVRLCAEFYAMSLVGINGIRKV